MTLALLFPGQGSQSVGMGQALGGAFAEAREVYEEVEEALKQRLTRIMFEGPPDTLTLTENTQPALMTVSLAVIRVLQRQGGFDVGERCAFVAGHSMGEYAALTTTGALGLGDAARLLRLRGKSMQEAVPVGEGAMAALIGASLEDAEAIAAAARINEQGEEEVCDVGNDNAPGQVVLSGAAGAIDRAIEVAKDKGVRRSVRLPVSAPFHCALMQPAADAMAAALETTTIARPTVPLVANVTAAATEQPEEIRRLLVEQVTGRVRWRECMQTMIEHGVDLFVECGAGTVLAGLARRIHRDAEVLSVGDPDSVEAFLARIG